MVALDTTQITAGNPSTRWEGREQAHRHCRPHVRWQAHDSMILHLLRQLAERQIVLASGSPRRKEILEKVVSATKPVAPSMALHDAARRPGLTVVDPTRVHGAGAASDHHSFELRREEPRQGVVREPAGVCERKRVAESA